MATVVIPSFDFTGFYYPELLEALFQFKRINVPELTDESPQEPFVQLMRMFALVGHLNNTLADMIANESTLPTAQLVETVRNMLRLIDYEMASATPSQVDMLYELAQILTSTQVVVPAGATSEASAQGEVPAIPFEVEDQLSVTRTDQFSIALRENQFVQNGTTNLSSTDLGITVTRGAGVWPTNVATAGMKLRLLSGTTGFPYRTALVAERISDTQLRLAGIGLRNNFTNLSWELLQDDVFTNVTANINNPAGGTETTPFVATIVVKDAFYLGHTEAMWNQLDITMDTPGSGISGVWEYYDGNHRETKPDSVTDIGNGQLQFVINGLLGVLDRKGSEIRVQFDETTAFEVIESEYNSVTQQNFIVASLLGQTSPSTDPDDYTIGSEWHTLDVLDDETTGLLITGTFTYTLPQTLLQDWNEVTLSGTEAFFLRFRITAITTAVSPIIDFVQMDQGSQFVKRLATQGRTQTDDPLGSSDGTASQEFAATRDFYIDGTAIVSVDSIEWTEVDNFLSSTPTDRHYVILLGEDDQALVKFGDGVAGLIPPAGVGNVAITYRYGADVDGNVGANTVTTDKTGLRLVNRLFNPRPAVGWKEAEGSTPESLERAKIDGPASLRVLRTALNGDDAVILARQFTDDQGAKPVARGIGIEEGFGPKTLELVLVGAGGGQLSTAQLDELDEFFNGNPFTSPPVPKRFVANAEVTCVNYSPRSISIMATVTVVQNSPVSAQAIKNRLLQVVQPLALREDSALYEWEFGEDIPVTRLIHEIFSVDESVLSVNVTDLNGIVPTIASVVTLAARDLPVLDTDSTFTVVESQ